MTKEEYIKIMMIQDRIIALQQECEEVCMQSDTPDYRALYFKLFAQLELLRKLLADAVAESV